MTFSSAAIKTLIESASEYSTKVGGGGGELMFWIGSWSVVTGAKGRVEIEYLSDIRILEHNGGKGSPPRPNTIYWSRMSF